MDVYSEQDMMKWIAAEIERISIEISELEVEMIGRKREEPRKVVTLANNSEIIKSPTIDQKVPLFFYSCFFMLVYFPPFLPNLCSHSSFKVFRDFSVV